MYSGKLILKYGLILAAIFLGLGLYCIFYGAKHSEELYRKQHGDEDKYKLLRESRSFWIYGISSFIMSALFLIVSSFIPIDWFGSWRRKRRDQLNRRLRYHQIRVISFNPPDVEYTPDNPENEQRFKIILFDFHLHYWQLVEFIKKMELKL